ncbi:MAG: hypothetical protein DRH08_00945 [Deltaproteobacteria bacterium]|nr:MAG: hypothetical protein DRH08_00945 [Deltaproteobacteria bacterium]
MVRQSMETEKIQEFKEMEWFGRRVQKARYTLSEHVIRLLVTGEFSIHDIETVLMTGRVLEERRNSKRATSYLVYGESNRKPLHVVCAADVNHCLVVLFAYPPALPIWKSPTERNISGEDKMTKSIGTCFFCGGELVEITVGNYYYRYEGQMIVVKNLPAILCQQCQEKYINADVGKKLNSLIDRRAFSGTETADVINYES